MENWFHLNQLQYNSKMLHYKWMLYVTIFWWYNTGWHNSYRSFIFSLHYVFLMLPGLFANVFKFTYFCFSKIFSDLTIRSSSSGRVSLRWRLERARGGVGGGSRNSLSSWSVLTRQETSPTNAWASLAVIALENPRPCRGGEQQLCSKSRGWTTQRRCGLITAFINHQASCWALKTSLWAFSFVLGGKFRRALQCSTMSAKIN